MASTGIITYDYIIVDFVLDFYTWLHLELLFRAVLHLITYSALGMSSFMPKYMLEGLLRDFYSKSYVAF